MVRHRILIMVAFLMAGFVSACGSGPAKVQSEEQKVQDIITSAPDMANNPTAAKGHFASGRVPDQATLKKISTATLIPELPRISGDQATVKVSVRAQGEAELGNVEWVLVKEQDRWRIQSAPMP